MSLRHDMMFGLTREIMGIIDLVIEREEYAKIFPVVYQTIAAAMERYEKKLGRRDDRLGGLGPSDN